MADGTILVVKIGSTTFDNVTRAMQSLCENNVLGIVANGARASELYSKYTTITRERNSVDRAAARLPVPHLERLDPDLRGHGSVEADWGGYRRSLPGRSSRNGP